MSPGDNPANEGPFELTYLIHILLI